MLGNNLYTIDLITVLVLFSIIISLLGIPLQRKGIISKMVFRYIYTPLAIFPTFFVTTYAVWPNLHFVFRVLIAIGVLILAFAYFYFIWQPLAARIFPSYRKRLEKDK